MSVPAMLISTALATRATISKKYLPDWNPTGANQTLTADLGIGILDGGDQTDDTALAPDQLDETAVTLMGS